MRVGFSSILFLSIILALGWFCPLPEKTEVPTSFSFYDRNGSLLYKEAGFETTSETAPEFLKSALIALEDKNFKTHAGVDLMALARAMKQNLLSGETVSGASTITMQLARLKFLEMERRDWWYKLRQTFWALKLEQKLSKAEILEQYLNRVNLGHNVQGFHAAAEHYFSKQLDQLSVAELATLLAIVQNPSQFNPISNPDLALTRRNLMLRRLYEADLIETPDYTYWVTQPIKLQPNVDNFIVAPHFVFWVKRQLADIRFPAKEINIYTTLDKTLYQDSLNILQETLKREQQTKKMHNGAIVVLDDQNDIRVLVGSPDFFEATIDGAVNLATSPRQTGSVLKPFLYALALQKGWSPAQALNDQKTIFPEGYLPRNFNIEEENGLVRFREALANSYNIAAVDLLNRIGVDPFYAFLQSLGFGLQQEAETLGLSLVLGSAQTSLLSLTQGYSIFTHQGELKPLNFIQSVETATGTVIYEPEKEPIKKVISTDTAEWVQQVLSDNQARWKNFSRGNSLELAFPSGAKTGTSQEFRDNWVLGFSPRYTVGVWVGNADGTPMVSSSGMQGAGPIWQKVMQRLHRHKPPLAFSYKGTRSLKTLCRRPGQTDCSEKVTAFLTPLDLDLLSQPEPLVEPGFSIVYPAENDVFAAGSDLLLQVRGSESEVDYYRHNGVISQGPIFENLTLGDHVFEAVNLDGNSAIVHIQVEEL